MTVLVGGPGEDSHGNAFHVEHSRPECSSPAVGLLIHAIDDREERGLFLTPAQARNLAEKLTDAANDLEPSGAHVCPPRGTHTGPALSREQGESIRLAFVAASAALDACETGGAVIPMSVARKLLELEEALGVAYRRLRESSGPAGLVPGKRAT